MIIRSTLVAVALGFGLATSAPAFALGLKDCSDKYSAAKAAGTLGTKTWAEFRKSECGKDATPATPAAATTPAPAAQPKPAPAAAPAPAPKPAPAPAAAGSPVFPSAVDSKYSSLKPGRAREKTCLDQYRANKATNANGGLKWIQRGGGYYSQCNKRLKG